MLSADAPTGRKIDMVEQYGMYAGVFTPTIHGNRLFTAGNVTSISNTGDLQLDYSQESS